MRSKGSPGEDGQRRPWCSPCAARGGRPALSPALRDVGHKFRGNPGGGACACRVVGLFQEVLVREYKSFAWRALLSGSWGCQNIFLAGFFFF